MFKTKAIRAFGEAAAGLPGGWMADALPLSGGIDPKTFPFVIAQLHRQAATGSLKVDGPSYQKAIYFRGGRILFGSSNDPKDQLGAILIETGRISPEQLEEVNAKVGPGNPLAKVLAESGFVNQRELSEAARTKVERILADVLSYDSGSFEFEDGVLPKGAVDLKLVTERVIVAAVRRITDRSFVLRHIEGLDVVLVPSPDAGERIAGLDADTTVLPQRFDGRRNIKEAAAEARLDEFDAAKICCALLFLGLAERAHPDELEVTEADGPALFTPGDLGAELDLGQEARLAVDGVDASDSDATMLISELPDFDTAPPTPLEASPAAPQPQAEPATLPRMAAPQLQNEPAAEPAQEPETMILPAPGEGPTTTGFFDAPPAIEAEEEEPPAASPAKAGPPSKEDLAALDALLNARHVEGPLAPFEKLAKTAGETRWEPRFDGRGGRRPGRRQPARGKLLGAIAVLALAAGAAAWFFVLRPHASAPRASATPPATTLPAVTLAPSAASPPPALSAPATTPPTTQAVAATTGRPTPAPPTLSARSATPGSLDDARAGLKRGDLAAAARGFAANLRSARSTYTVQLLVACSDETVTKAVQAVGAPDLFIVPVNYKGRDCYRMCWGLYENEGRARSGIGSVPEYFRKGGASPRAVSASSVLP
jgi:Domain of unknown function (DUF4388)